jgi:hypothetical protein
MKILTILLLITLLFPIPRINAQTLSDVILPQYIQGNTGTNSNRIPFAYRATITGLTPDVTYRYYNQVVISTDASTASGAGNVIFISDSGNFVRTSSVDLSTTGRYNTFTTDATGSFSGWFATEPTGNASRFVPGKYIYMRIMLNDGAGGTSVVTRLTTTDSVRVLRLDTVAADSAGTGLRCTSSASAKDFVLLYDNIDGTGRPIAASFIESDGTDNTTTNNYTSFYSTDVNGTAGAFGVVLPNLLPNGIRRIECRSLLTGAIIASATDEDGVWPSTANTVNPSGGTTPIVLTNSDAPLVTTDVNDISGYPLSLNLYQNYPNPFNPNTTISYQLAALNHVTLKVFDMLGREVVVLVNRIEEPGDKSVMFDASRLPSGMYFYRLSAGSLMQTKKLLLLK